MTRLLREMGPQAPIWKAWDQLNADCPKREAHGAGEACSLYGPQLPKLFMGAAPE